MQPRKDYDDYTRFINDSLGQTKSDLLNRTIEFEESRSP